MFDTKCGKAVGVSLLCLVLVYPMFCFDNTLFLIGDFNFLLLFFGGVNYCFSFVLIECGNDVGDSL